MITTPSLKSMIISIDSTIRDAIEAINDNSQGVCFVVENKTKFKGLITDGDLRRAFLSGAEKNSSVKGYMKKDALTLPISASPVEIQKSLSSIIKHIPLIDLEGNIKDYVSNNHFQRIPLAEPLLSGNEINYVNECLKTNWISSRGRFVDEFENSFSNYHNMPNALAVSNGTVALSLALEALGIGKDDEVIVPDLTFAASINAIIHAGATPVLVDVNLETWTLDVRQFEEAISQKTKAVMPVHLYGHPSEMNKIVEIAKRNKLFIVEDCAEALGSKINNTMIGTFGDASCFSFFGNKTITTGEGGMILFKDQKIAQKARILRDHGMNPERRYWHDVIGYNYRMTNIQAAIGLAQMERIEYFINHKRNLAKEYLNEMKNIDFVLHPPEASWAYNTYWLYSVLILPESELNRDDLIRAMSLNGIETRPVFYPLHEMPIYKKYIKGNKFPNSKFISDHGICLPSASTASLEDVIKVSKVFKNIIESIRLFKKTQN